jgi:hypothetical protein
VGALLRLLPAQHLPPYVLWHSAVLMRTWLGAHALPLRLQQPHLSQQQQQQQQQAPPPASTVSPHTPTDRTRPGGSAPARPWACSLSHEQREALAIAVQAAVAEANVELDGMWCEAFFTLMCLEWPAAGQAILRPVLRVSSDIIMSGPHLFPTGPAQVGGVI